MTRASRIGRLVRLLGLSLILPVLAACAAPARIGEMTATSLPSDVLAQATSSPLHRAVAVGSVTGGKETNPMWVSQVGNVEFRQALAQSLNTAGLLSFKEPAPYTVNATLKRLDQPVIGFDLTVTTHVEYVIERTDTRSPVFRTDVIVPYTASFGSSLLAVERLRLANEGAIRVNMERFLSEAVRGVKAPPSTTTTPTS